MQLRDVPKSHCEYVCMRLLRGAQKEHFIEVVRPVRNSKAPRRSLPEELRARPKYA
jgi:hypothetical protein